MVTFNWKNEKEGQCFTQAQICPLTLKLVHVVRKHRKVIFKTNRLRVADVVLLVRYGDVVPEDPVEGVNVRVFPVHGLGHLEIGSITLDHKGEQARWNAIPPVCIGKEVNTRGIISSLSKEN